MQAFIDTFQNIALQVECFTFSPAMSYCILIVIGMLALLTAKLIGELMR